MKSSNVNSEKLPWKRMTTKTMMVKIMANKLLLEDELAFEAFFCASRAFIRSILALLIMDSWASSLISFWSAASKERARCGRGGFFALRGFSFVLISSFGSSSTLTKCSGVSLAFVALKTSTQTWCSIGEWCSESINAKKKQVHNYHIICIWLLKPALLELKDKSKKSGKHVQNHLWLIWNWM